MTPSKTFASLIESGSQHGWAFPARIKALELAGQEMSVDGAWALRRMLHWFNDEVLAGPELVRSFGSTLALDPGEGFVFRGAKKVAQSGDATTERTAAVHSAPRQIVAGDYGAQWDASESIRTEFPTKRGFELFMAAQSEGRVIFLKTPCQRLESAPTLSPASPSETVPARNEAVDDELARAEAHLDEQVALGKIHVFYHGSHAANVPTAPALAAPVKKLATPTKPALSGQPVAADEGEYGAAWDKSKNLQAEFPTRKGYELFMAAQSEGRVRLYQR